ncbi:MAG: 50S ribosomal protein L23 [Coxiellaceae bacterium]|jgi:large subunit ribosomal protein L23|nr:50S ribosomal protein L23 [Coxiellaceae bacterium]
MNVEKLTKIIISPCISEKSTKLQMDGQCIFSVARKATKKEIAHAVKALFNVDVKAVRVCNVRGKKRNFRNILGNLNNWKKAFITIKEGQAVNLNDRVNL